MPRAKQVKNKTVGISRTLGVLALLCLAFGWSRPALSADEPAAPESAPESAPEPTLQLAPIRLRLRTFGSLDYSLRHDQWSSQSGTSQLMQQTQEVTVGGKLTADSFIWQPWLVRLGGDLGVAVGGALSDGGTSFRSMSRSGESAFRTVTGEARLSVVPRSRFPFKINFSRTDNRHEAGLIKTGSASQNDQFTLSQSYRTRAGGEGISATYGRGRAELQGEGVSHREDVAVDVSLLPGRGQGLGISFFKAYRDEFGQNETSWNSSLIGRHSYRPNHQFSVATMASRVNTSAYYRLASGGRGLETLQVSSAGTWRPNDSFTMTGGVRLFEESSINNGIYTLGSSYTGGNLGANYAVAKWLRLYGSVTVYDSSGVQDASSLGTLFGNLSVGAQHRFQPIKLGRFDYTRSVAANLSNNINSRTNSGTVPPGNAGNIGNSSTETYQTYSLRLQHGLGNNTVLGNGRLASSLSQGISSAGGSGRLPNWRSTHGGSLSWSRRGEVIRLVVSDSRSLGGARDFYQSVNLQGSQTESLKNSASLTGNITANASRQGYAGSSLPTTDSLTSTANLIYRSSRAFGVRNMTFSSKLEVISADLLQSSDLNQNSQNQGQYSWENELDYRIGLLEIEVKGLVEEVQSSKRISLLFHARRSF